MKKVLVFFMLVMMLNHSLAQEKTVNVATIRDSLDFLYNEKLQRQIDSLNTEFETQKKKFLTKFNVERENYSKKIKQLADSLTVLNQKKSTPAPITSQPAEHKSTYDHGLEQKHFTYLSHLKSKEKKKKSIFNKLGIGGEDIIEFQLREMNNYLNAYFPGARSEKIQSFIVNLSLSSNQYAKAEKELLKYAYFYVDTENYLFTIDKFLSEVNKNNYFKDRKSFISKKVNSVLKKTSLASRYFEYIELLSSYPNDDVKQFFMDEAYDFLSRYPGNKQSPRVLLWMADHFLITENPHKAFIVAQKIETLYKSTTFYPHALFMQADIQENNFEEYKEAIKSYETFIDVFPNNEKTQEAMFRVGKIFDEELKKYEKAIDAFNRFADTYQSADRSVFCLNRASDLYYKELDALQSAVKQLELIEERYSGSDAGKKALYKSALIYRDEKYYKNALVQFDKVFKQYPASEEGRLALEESAVIYLEEMENQKKGKEMLSLLVKHFPKSKSAKNAKQRLEKIAEDEAEKAAKREQTITPENKEEE